MTPLMMRIFTLVGIALAASLQLKARADTESPGVPVPCVVAVPYH